MSELDMPYEKYNELMEGSFKLHRAICMDFERFELAIHNFVLERTTDLANYNRVKPRHVDAIIALLITYGKGPDASIHRLEVLPNQLVFEVESQIRFTEIKRNEYTYKMELVREHYVTEIDRYILDLTHRSLLRMNNEESIVVYEHSYSYVFHLLTNFEFFLRMIFLYDAENEVCI